MKLTSNNGKLYLRDEYADPFCEHCGRPLFHLAEWDGMRLRWRGFKCLEGCWDE